MATVSNRPVSEVDNISAKKREGLHSPSLKMFRRKNGRQIPTSTSPVIPQRDGIRKFWPNTQRGATYSGKKSTLATESEASHRQARNDYSGADVERIAESRTKEATAAHSSVSDVPLHLSGKQQHSTKTNENLGVSHNFGSVHIYKRGPSDDSRNKKTRKTRSHAAITLSDDPTIEESIECIFSQKKDTDSSGPIDPWSDDEDGGSTEGSVGHRDEVNHKSTESQLTLAKANNRDDCYIPPACSVTDLSWIIPRLMGKANSTSHHELAETLDWKQEHSDSRDSDSTHGIEKDSSAPAKPNTPQRQGRKSSLVYVGSFAPSLDEEPEPPLEVTKPPSQSSLLVDLRLSGPTRHLSTRNLSIRRPACKTCLSHQLAPSLAPESWPQGPMFLRPTPGSNTRVRGVRFASSSEYLWHVDNEESSKNWWESLRQSWTDSGMTPTTPRIKHTTGASFTDDPIYNCCSECCCIPANNGNEAEGKTLVVDFESELFVGTLLIRIRGCEGTTPHPYNDESGYFAGMNRRYQAVVRGMFKKDGIPMTECITGQINERPYGKLPPKLIVRGAVKVVSFFAPQLQAKVDGPSPAFVTPLGSTPQTVIVESSVTNEKASYRADESLELGQEEPAEAAKSLLSQPNSGAPSSMARAKARKKAFDKLYALKQKSLTFQTDMIYTFEFLQHLLDFTEFTVDLGPMLGKLRLSEILDGQPMKFMGAHQHPDAKANTNGGGLDWLWSFDIWHANVIEAAKKHDSEMLR